MLRALNMIGLFLLSVLNDVLFLCSVVTMESHPFAVGETITMRLMKRAKV